MLTRHLLIGAMKCVILMGPWLAALLSNHYGSYVFLNKDTFKWFWIINILYEISNKRTWFLKVYRFSKTNKSISY